MCGTADLTLQRAVTDLRAAGHVSIADELDDVLVGRDVIAGRWSYQLVEDCDARRAELVPGQDGHWTSHLPRRRRAQRVDRGALTCNVRT
jgi:hypothetical protein